MTEVIGEEELERIQRRVGRRAYAAGRDDEAWDLFQLVTRGGEFVEFLTLPAHDSID